LEVDVAKIKKMPVAGMGEVNVKDVDFNIVREEWSEYTMEGGGSIRIRATALRISRIVDAQGKPTYQPDGQPAVVVNSQVQIIASD
jgi:hypothetical protein